MANRINFDAGERFTITIPEIEGTKTPDQKIDDLRERVTQLEQQNAQLSERLVVALETIANKLPTRDWLEGYKRSVTKK